MNLIHKPNENERREQPREHKKERGRENVYTIYII